ncbi:epidermal growth factor receptor kinase substrate 8-like protein 1 [Brienomyrus brachyistius]|uniref:epidermal growth factor receptor kinase substrate 8-like protein 1 n=1 Tax=Brienomyrus brachyistius TaxID=42636 RepID=UPI0020B3DDDD|nr:epidermal growth factor receptor kinase substrate 8-like protein 1 [Brienomyrus brachyistius]XP_048869131.1 epidermal growth factor receptor kinase substrate 8-like protein 1 [Brienomyrus brachyistius]XP_048869132.1 epidermal growth factor receptor kinase substrate 8-like protein 1 [Brienomyrus brachyistius]XP_048869133.1 epidermal growth factor receptor kinase substrate 8-like protein 1 [Brienomyrus brachyistius]
MADISQYLVNHLVTFSLQGGEVQSVEEALSRLSHLARTDRLWSQEMLVEVSRDTVRLRDAQNQDELEAYPVSCIHRCDAILTEKEFPSLLLLVCQYGPRKKPDIHFFNCENIGAEPIRDDIISAVSDHTSKTNRRPEVLRMNQARLVQPSTAAGAMKEQGPQGIPNPPLLQAPNLPPSTPPPHSGMKVNGSSGDQANQAFRQAQREVEILNHCFNDIEIFMGRLQKSAEAHSILSQRNKKKKKSSKSPEDDLLSLRARPPSENEFFDIFQKFKYCFSLLARLKTSITNPSSEELLHHVFKPLDMIVKTTGGPTLGAGVASPALTDAAVSLLQENLTPEETQLWTALGPNWTQARSQQRGPVLSYTPVFLDGWKPDPVDPHGRVWEDPIEAQHKLDSQRKQQRSSIRSVELPKFAAHAGDEVEGSGLPPEAERLYRCSYDFVARNSSELSVLHGETLEVIESSKRWWKCRNRFDQIGFVPFNILEPLSALNDTNMQNLDDQMKPKGNASPTAPRPYSYAPPASPPLPDPTTFRPRSMPSNPSHIMSGDSTDRVMVMNDELLQRLTHGKASFSRPLVIPRSSDTSAPLHYNSPPSEVEEWLRGKGFSEPTVSCLGVLTGAQLFSLNKEELRAVLPDEGTRVYSQIMVQKALLEDAHKVSELEAVMEKQKMKVDHNLESTTF